MARNNFGGTSGDSVFAQGIDRALRPTSASLLLWDAQTGGSQVTDLLLDGVEVATIPVPSDGQIPQFQGPDGVTHLWASGAVNGKRILLPTTTRDRETLVGTQSLDNTTDSATRLAMTAAERAKLAALSTSTSTVVRHESNAAMARPTTNSTVIWVGTAIPNNIAAGDLFFITGTGGGGGGGTFTGALDAFATPHRVLSLRRTLTAYTGPLVRVRRSSDSTEQDIGYSATGTLDEAALTSFAGAGSAYVTTWYDQSGSARNLTQTTAAAQPRIVNAGTIDKINAKPAMVFDGVDDLLSSTVTGLYAAGTASAAIVMSGASATNSTVLQESNTASGANYRVLRSDQSRWYVQGTNDAGTSLWAVTVSGDITFNSAQHRLFYADTGTAISTWRDGVAGHNAITATRSGALTVNRVVIGANISSSATNNFYSGSLQEVVTWTSNRTTDRSAITTAQSYWTT